MIKRIMAALLLLLALLSLAAELTQAARSNCLDEDNLTTNCDMDTFSDHSSGNDIRIVADGWWFWVEEGNPAFDVGQDSTDPPSQRIWSDGGNFRAGIYQQVSNLTPGATYIAGANWLPYTSPDGSIMRQLGLDPTGGTEPNAATVLWGPEDWKFSRFTDLEQTAVATGTSMTIFIRVYNPVSHGADQIFIDTAWMKQDTVYQCRRLPPQPLCRQRQPSPRLIHPFPRKRQIAFSLAKPPMVKALFRFAMMRKLVFVPLSNSGGFRK